uniref:Uncharacterized protein n=1 Tax=Arundo donax TaxID=35708 RepID=A0A0A9ERP6_ARUDO
MLAPHLPENRHLNNRKPLVNVLPYLEDLLGQKEKLHDEKFREIKCFNYKNEIPNRF